MSTQKSRRNTPGVFSESIKMLLIIKRHLQFVNFHFAGQEAKILDNQFSTRYSEADLRRKVFLIMLPWT